MRLLFITQKVDVRDPVLGFVHGWITEFARTFDTVEVVCLERGETSLPAHISVFSLGKEKGASRFKRMISFFSVIWRLRNQYEGVFVHMNPEYVILGGLLWRLWGKKIVLWYNHSHADIRLAFAMKFSHVVCHTSPRSASARTSKSVRMPVGIDTEIFSYDERSIRPKQSILSLGRIAPVKRIDVLVAAVRDLFVSSIPLSLSIIGDPLQKDNEYYQSLVLQAPAGVSFIKGVGDRSAVAALYNQHRFFWNGSPSGLFDKTVFESILCGCIPIVSSTAFEELLPSECFFKEGDPMSLGSTLRNLLLTNSTHLNELSSALRDRVRVEHSLTALAQKVKTLYV